LRPEEEFAGINCDIADFLSEMTPDPTVPVIVCVNAGDSMKKLEQNLGGQFWMQGDRTISATNVQFEGTENDAISVTLAAVAEAVEWKHALELDVVKRPGQRVVIYPPTLEKLGTVRESRDSSLDCEDGHDISYQRFLSACDSFENPPRFFSSNCGDFGGLDIAAQVPKWMYTAAQISIGGRNQVLENGNDVCNSESDSENEEHGDDLKDMYTSEIKIGKDGRPVNSGLYRLTPDQASASRAGATRCSGESKGSTTQARPRVNEYESGTSSPSPDLGTAAGSCKPTTQRLDTRSMVLAPENSNVEASQPTVSTSRAQKGRAGGQGTGASVKRAKGTRATGGRPPDTLPT
jgi:hypothetical protein